MSGRAVICTSSGLPLISKKSTAFPCPECGNSIGRSEKCRVQSVMYICTECGFQGP
ncbi:MAG: zinc finger domain-containing protein [Candidatus Thermoplasmatota archaeon]|nr:zinc finger domain-containing protein [Candidatus Thermoplasmatota archaeon]MED5158841.1 zinc finger domain-containing protein [Candidatus Thermoplasmatota archaeon]MEE3231974.1 zinc finger domain-containing protein [Candidatus Thermoplasmatota archaeon]MEE3277491.1 zinc finger domain-containing protein [Candidatus Thermoplasmatota archaeon]MEE3318835.1 zinc finger domain-containing protein [Candidatus Thermoplasmatota archaeon]